jgi:hypothetical protein
MVAVTDTTIHAAGSTRPPAKNHATSVCLTSSKIGVGVWRVTVSDGTRMNAYEFREHDPLLRRALESLQPVERGKIYPVDFDIVWHQYEGWPTVREPIVSREDDMPKLIEQQVDAEHAAYMAARPETEFDTFDKTDAAPVVTTEPEPEPHWTEGDEGPGFFAWWNGQLKDRDIDKSLSDVLRYSIGGVSKEKTLKAYKGTSAEYKKLATTWLREHFPTEGEKRMIERLANIIPTSPSVDEKPGLGRETPVSGTPLPSPLPEAPFSANFRLFHKTGVDVQFTVRADTVNEGVKRVDATIEHLLNSGYSAERPHAPATAAAPTTANMQVLPPPTVAVSTAPIATAGGTVRAVEVKKIQDEGKTKIQFFDSVGADSPAITIRTESDFQKLKATGLAVDQLVVGSRYAWPVDIDWTPGKNNPKTNKPFRDVTAIRKAA